MSCQSLPCFPRGILAALVIPVWAYYSTLSPKMYSVLIPFDPSLATAHLLCQNRISQVISPFCSCLPHSSGMSFLSIGINFVSWCSSIRMNPFPWLINGLNLGLHVLSMPHVLHCRLFTEVIYYAYCKRAGKAALCCVPLGTQPACHRIH